MTDSKKTKAEKEAAKQQEELRENADEAGVHIASPDEVGNPGTPPPPKQGSSDDE